MEYLLEFLNQVKEQAPQALERVQYIEQPTARDLKANPDNKMHEAAKIKPVVIDESLVDYESLLLAREMGYTGVALKACRAIAVSVNGSRSTEIQHVSLCAGFDLSQRFFCSFRQSGFPCSSGGSDRRNARQYCGRQ